MKRFCLVIFGTLVTFGLLVNCGGGGGSGSYDGPLVVVSQGIDLVTYKVPSSGVIKEADRASLAGSVLPQHAIFGITKYPSEKVLYTGSLNECGNETNACWGNGRIDRFTYDDNGILNYDGMAFYYGSGSGPSCANVDWGYPGQEGACAPTTITFSPDGTRAYVDDDYDDVVQIFSVNADGDFTFLWEGSGTSYNGLTASPSGDYLYNGSAVLELSGDTALDPIDFDGEGNATEIASVGGTDMLVTTLSNEELAAYTLTNESTPAIIATIGISEISSVHGPGPAVYQDHTSDLSQFVVVGNESVASVGFDGSTFTLLDQVADADTTNDYIYRSVVVTDDGYALVTWFNTTWDNDTGPYPGGVDVYEIAADGALTKIDSIATTDRVGRASLALRK